MTNPDRDELVKLADRVAETPAYTAKDFRIWRKPILHRCDDPDGNSNASVILINAKHREAVATALRRLASSEGGVKGEPEPVAWPSDGSCVRCGAVPRTASGLCNTCLDEDAERYENAPPADAGMREALEEIEALCRHLRQGGPDPMDLQELSDALEEATNLASEALTAPGATTKSDGGERDR